MKREIPFTSIQQVHKKIGKRRIVLFGAGQIAGKTIRMFGGKEMAAIVDNSENLWNTEEQGLQVLAPEKLTDFTDCYTLICTTSFAEVSLQLLEMGLESGEDFAVSPVLNDLRIIDEIENIEKRMIFSSGAPPQDDPKAGGGIFELEISGTEWDYRKVFSGNCYGIAQYNNNYITVDNKRGIIEFDSSYEVVQEAELPLGIRAHGVAFSEKHRLFFVACSYLDAIMVLDESFKVVDTIAISKKIDSLEVPQHHCNDCCVVDDSLYVSMFSHTGNWRKEVYDGVVLEFDIGTREVVGPVFRDLSMPHNVTMLGGELVVLDSLRGYLRGANGKPIGQFPGFTRGLAWDGIYYFLGQSRNRNFSKNLGLSLNTSIDTSIIIFDAETKVSRSIFLPSKVSEIHSVILI